MLRTNNNQDFTTRGLVYTYQAAQSVAAVNPTLGPAVGNGLVTVTGAGFYGPTVYCRFGVSVVSSTPASSTHVVCTTPAAAAGSVAVEMSNNNQDFTADNVQYLYLVDMSLSSMVPASGPVTGGTPVVLYGSNVPNSVTLTCRFGTRLLRRRM